MTKTTLQRFTIAAVSVFASTVTMFADVSDLPVKEVNGQRFHYYEVQPRETVYALTRKLGITAEELYRNNPSARDGLKANAVLLFPVESVKSATPVISGRKTHKVVKGETVYGIGKKYGVTKDEIFVWNPGSSDGIRPGQELYVSAPSDDSRKESVEESSPSTVIEKTVSGHNGYVDYIVKDKETFYSIARSNGLTIHELEEANPGVGILRPGSVVKIPVKGSSGESVVAQAVRTEETPLVSVSETVETAVDTIVPETLKPQSINIALTLPLNADASIRDRHSDIYLEFYKGFLMAVDSMRHCGTPINIHTFDTHGSVDTLLSIINGPALNGIRVVIGPDNEDQLNRLSGYGRLNDVYIFNPFVVKDEGFVNNPYILQANIPQSMMYDKAIDGIITRYANYLPVLVTHAGGMTDKEGFVDRLRQRLKQAGIEYRDVAFGNQLTADDFNDLPQDKNLLIVPLSGRQPELNKILPAVIKLKDSGRDLALFGYPEWTTFKGETMDNMHKVNTVVYSRFYSADDKETEVIDQKFVYWYGKPMMNVLPRQGLLGFDTGMYLINALLDTRGDLSKPVPFRDGIQNGFHFVSPDGSQGLVNDVLYFINFRPDNTVDKTVL